MPSAVVAVLCAALLVACGEPDVDLDVPQRQEGQVLLDEAGILEGTDVDARLRDLAEEGLDVVAVTYETPQASLGETRRAGQLVLEEWDADIALVAVARPGDFTATDPDDRERFFGLESADHFAVPRGLRERIAEEQAPPLAAANDWEGVFSMAVDELEAELVGEGRDRASG